MVSIFICPILDQYVGYLIRDDVVVLLSGLGREPDQELVEGSRFVDYLRVEECWREGDLESNLPLIVDLFNQAG